MSVGDVSSDASWLTAASEDPYGLASLIVEHNLVVHRELAAERQKLGFINRVSESVSMDLAQGNLRSTTFDALRVAEVPISRLQKTIKEEIQAGRWSLRNQGRQGPVPANLSRALQEVAASWQRAVAVANTAYAELVEYSKATFDAYEMHARRMWHGERSYLAPFVYPQTDYIGDQLARDPAYMDKRRPFSRWLMSVRPLPDREWAILPRIDLGELNIVFLSDNSSLMYGEAVLAAQGIASDQMSRAAPNHLMVTWIDSADNGRSAGPFLRLAQRNSKIIDSGQVWTASAGIESALLRASNRMAELERSCLGGEFADLNAYNSQAGSVSEFNQLIIVTGYPVGFAESSARLLRQLTENNGRLGLSVITVMHPSMASMVKMVDAATPSYAEMIDGPGPANAPAWWSAQYLPIGEFVVGHAESPYIQVSTFSEGEAAWVPCDLRIPEPATQLRVIDGYAEASTQLALTGKSPRVLHQEGLDFSLRAVAVRNAMLKWLLTESQSLRRQIDWESFLESDSAFRLGGAIGYGELAAQAAYLQEEGFINASKLGSDDPSGMLNPQLTSKGEDMAMKENPELDDFARSSGGRPRAGTTINNIAPVFHADASGATFTWGNRDVVINQNRQQTEQVAPGYEELARVVVQMLQGLPKIGLPADDLEDARESADEILTELATSDPNRGKVRRSIAAIRGFLMPIANDTVLGAGEGAHDFARTALEQLQNVVF